MSTTQRFIPTIGVSGFYHLLSPFTIEDHNAIYTCKAIRKISELLAEGTDVFNDVYKEKGLSQDTYDEDVQDDAEIIYLESSNNRWISVPSRYLSGYPNMNGEPYRRVSIVISLPAFPLQHSFDNAIHQLQEVVTMTLGVNSEAKVVVTSKAILVEDAKHKVLDAQRKTETEKSTPSARANFWRQSYDNLMEKYNAIVKTLT